MRRILSTTLGQLLSIIAASSAATFVLFLVALWILHPDTPPRPPWPWKTAYRVAGLAATLQALPPSERATVINAFQQVPGIVSIHLTSDADSCQSFTPGAHDLEAILKSELSAVSKLTTAKVCQSNTTGTARILLDLQDQTLDINISKADSPPPRIPFPLMTWAFFLCGAVTSISAWAIWRVIRPLRRLSEQADAFGRNIAIAPIKEEGPLEIRSAARAFNRMQERITRSMRDRTLMLAAISHDLRTPLTRMRLQLDTGEMADIKNKLLRDITLMQSMTASALSFLRGKSIAEKKEWLDLGALLTTLCDEYTEREFDISYIGPEHLTFFCRPNAIARAITNLIENGIYFGKKTTVATSTSDHELIIDVIDDGPGIPQSSISDVVEPFVRLDRSRYDRPGSVGLGLSIVKDIAGSHGGVLELLESQPNGLIARLRLPRLSETDADF